MLAIVGETNAGKAQPLDALVLTTSGWVKMGDLNVGDMLASPDNAYSEVLAIHPQGLKQVYRVTLSDGRSTEVCAEHLWEVWQANWTRYGQSGYRVVSTQQLMELSKRSKERTYIRRPVAQEMKSQELPLDPWLLGALIGDGGLTGLTPGFTTADLEMIKLVRASLPHGVTIQKKTSGIYDYSITGRPNTLTLALRQLGVAGYRSYEKSIPEPYMHGSIKQRSRLIAGLMDTDGYVSKLGGLSYTTTSETLANQFAYIIRSLGGVASVGQKMGAYKKNGLRRETRTAYTVGFWVPNPLDIVTLPRKRRRVKYKEEWKLSIKNIVPTRVTEAQCITTSHNDELYITDNFVVTHNTLVGLEICSSLVTGEPLWGSVIPTRKCKRILYVLGEHRNRKILELVKKTRLPMTDDVLLLGPDKLRGDKNLIVQGVPNQRVIDNFKRWVEGMDLVLFDPLSSFIAGADTENDNNQMRLLIESMNNVCMVAGASCIVLAHKGKPTLDQYGKEHRRHSYATRGASGTEDAFTNIWYLNKADSGLQDYELLQRKFKGDAPPRFHLRRNKETLTHTLLTDGSSYNDVLKREARDRVTNLRYDFPTMAEEMVHKVVASTMGIPLETLERRLGLKK